MARVHVVYVYSELENSGCMSEGKDLCFICATKLAVSSNTKDTKIAIKTCNHEFSQCNFCREYIDDVIDI